MDKTIAKILTNKEKLSQEITFSSRFLNIMMILSLIKWTMIFAVISTIFFLVGHFKEYAPPVEMPFMGIGNLSSVAGDFFTRIWSLPIAILVVLVLPLVFLYYQFYLRVANRYVLTDQRLIFKRGWLSTEIESIHYDRITDVLVTQSLWDRLFFNSGKIFINTAGGEDYEATMLNINNPYGLKKEIYALKENYISARSSGDLAPLGRNND